MLSMHLLQLARVRVAPPDRSESRQVSISVQLCAASSHAPPLLSLLLLPGSEAAPGVGPLDRQHAPVLHLGGLAADFLPCRVVDVWGASCVQGAVQGPPLGPLSPSQSGRVRSVPDPGVHRVHWDCPCMVPPFDRPSLEVGIHGDHFGRGSPCRSFSAHYVGHD